MTRRKRPVCRKPPAWLVAGAVVDYRSMIGGPVTVASARVRSEPWQLGHGEWVVMIEGVTGGVALDAITRVPQPVVRIQGFSLEVETTDGRGNVRALSIEGEDLDGAAAGALLGGIIGAVRGRDV